MEILKELSAHRQNGWKGQYNRMIRWSKRFQEIASKNQDENKDHIYYGFFYASLQNIFFLKDWLKHDTNISNQELNHFINNNWEIGICRDICNGTKHFEINNPSIDSDFSIIREFNPFHKTLNQTSYKIVILAGGRKIEPFQLISKCIKLWNEFIDSKLAVNKKIID